MRSPSVSLLLLVCLGLCTPRIRAEETAPADSLRKYRFLAKEARDKNEYDTALGYYQEYLKYQPDDEKAHFWVGSIHYEKHDFAAARQSFARALAIDSLHFNSVLMLYQVYLQEEQPDSAAAYLERAMQIKADEPNYPQYRRTLADLFRRQGKTRQAIHHYEALAAGGDRELAELVAVLYEDLGEAQSALQWRRRSLNTAGGDSTRATAGGQREGLEAVADLQIKTKDFKGAFATLTQLAQLDTLNRYSYYSRIARLGEQTKDTSMRIKGLEGMVLANPKDIESLVALADWQLNANNLSAADKWIQRGLKADGRNGHLLVLRGDYLTRQGTQEEAIAAYEKAKGDPSWADVAQQRIWQLRPPETPEEKLKREFFGKGKTETQ